MFKIFVLLLVAVYILEAILLRRSHRRMFRDARTLVRFIVLAMLIFAGYTELPHLEFLQGSFLLQMLAVAGWFAAAYWLSWHISRFLTRE